MNIDSGTFYDINLTDVDKIFEKYGITPGKGDAENNDDDNGFLIVDIGREISSKDDEYADTTSIADVSGDDFKDIGPDDIASECDFEENSEAKLSFGFKFVRAFIDRYDIKLCNGNFYVYKFSIGCYQILNDLQLKTLIRSGHPPEVESRLNRMAVIDIIDRLQSQSSIQVDSDYFNSNENLMNFRNGVLNIENMTFKQHSPEYHFTSFIDGDYIENIEDDIDFSNYIETITNHDKGKQLQLQESVGYLISGYYRAKKAIFIIGVAHSGKSTLLRIIAVLVGYDNISNVPLNQLTSRFVTAHLSTKKLNICGELNCDKSLSNLEVFKSITGNDDMMAEYKGKDHFRYQSKVKLLFSGNQMPNIETNETTSAFFDRLCMIYFPISIPEDKRDQNFDKKLLSEKTRSSIIRWAVDGIRRLRDNNFIFHECQDSISFKKSYIFEQDHLSDYIKSYCIVSSEERVHNDRLYSCYCRYADENAFNKLDKASFQAQIEKHGFQKRKFRSPDFPNPKWGFIGIGIK